MDEALPTGTRVIYRGSWGIGPGKLGKITGTDTIQGRLVYDVQIDGEPTEVWGFDYQVTEAA